LTDSKILFAVELFDMVSSSELPFFAKSLECRQEAGFGAVSKEANRVKEAGNKKFSKKDYYGAIDW